MRQVFSDEQVELWDADAYDLLASLDDGTINLLVTDPPYFNVVDHEWDRQWKDVTAFLAWMDGWLAIVADKIAPNGSVYVFASPQMATRVELLVAERFNILNRITWAKPNSRAGQAEKEALRAFFPASEAVIFAEPHTATDAWNNVLGIAGGVEDGLRGSVFEPLREYLDTERRRAGMTVAELVKAMGVTTPSHYFSKSQWALPTAEHYETMRRILNESANGSGPVLDRDYENLRTDYEHVRRPFFAVKERPYTDTWTYQPVSDYNGKHPTEKPSDLMEHIILTSSRPGDLVVDPFAGSASTLQAAAKHSRRSIGGDITAEYLRQAADRLAHRQLPLFV